MISSVRFNISVNKQDSFVVWTVYLTLCLSVCARTLDVTIINFSLSKLLISHDELLRDQRGSLAYVSPDVLSGMFDVWN